MAAAPTGSPAATRPPGAWPRRAARGLALIGVGLFLYFQFGPRPAFLPLACRIDGPAIARASGVVVFLHGRSRSLAYAQGTADQMRAAGLPSSFAIVLVEAPYSTGFGHQWGETAQRQATARARLRARLRELSAAGGPPSQQWIIAGFSQGAGVAIDTAVEEPRFGALASFSPCLSVLRGELPKREGLRILLAHGRSDDVCPLEESRSLARVLAAAGKPAQYVEFEGGHEMPPEVLRAFVGFAARATGVDDARMLERSKTAVDFGRPSGVK
jgi:phospholipase/carboxylesterase